MEDEQATQRVTLRDIAREAGVSVATVSKALSGRKEVAEATRQRVREAAQALHFTPNPGTWHSLDRRTRTLGLLTGDLEGRLVTPILIGAEDAFGVGRNNVFLCNARGDSVREGHHVKALLDRPVDGIIVVGEQTDPRPSLGSLPVPVVYVYAPSDDPRDLSFTPDDEEGGRLSTEHLLSLGRTRIAHITGDTRNAAAHDRVRGFDAAMATAGIEPCGSVMFGAWTEQWGREACLTVLEQFPDVDGIVCGSDQIARGVLDMLRRHGRAVPHGVAIVGYDNWNVLTLGAEPQLSSVDANLEQLGRLAARKLFEALAGKELGAGVNRLPVSLVRRGSSVAERD